MLALQAAENFGFELAALRRSFRYNEYQEMEAQPNFFARVSHTRSSAECARYTCSNLELCTLQRASRMAAAVLPTCGQPHQPKAMATDSSYYLSECCGGPAVCEISLALLRATLLLKSAL